MPGAQPAQTAAGTRAARSACSTGSTLSEEPAAARRDDTAHDRTKRQAGDRQGAAPATLDRPAPCTLKAALLSGSPNFWGRGGRAPAVNKGSGAEIRLDSLAGKIVPCRGQQARSQLLALSL